MRFIGSTPLTDTLFVLNQALELLESSAYKEEVEEMMEEAQEKGIPGVPFTVINQKWAIAGGQTAEVFYSVSFSPLGRAWEEVGANKDGFGRFLRSWRRP